MIIKNAKRTIRLLKQVIESVNNAPPRKFNMDCWWDDCKTMGCAISWWIHDHPRSGLGLKYDPETQTIRVYHKKRGKKRCFWGMAAISECFEIPYFDAMFLFMAGYRKSPTDRRDVVNRLKEYVAQIEWRNQRLLKISSKA